MFCSILYFGLLVYGLCFALSYKLPEISLGHRFLFALLAEGVFAVMMLLAIGLFSLGEWVHDHCPFGK